MRTRNKARVLAAALVTIAPLASVSPAFAGGYGPAETVPSQQPATPKGTPAPEAGACEKNIAVMVPATLNTKRTSNPDNPHGIGSRTVGNALSQEPDTMVVTVPYNSAYPLMKISYNDSQQEGVNATTQMMTQKAAECPNSYFSIFGYSSGADIVAEVVSDINANRGPIPGDRLTAAVILSSPARNSATTTAIEGGTAAGNGAAAIKPAFDYGQLGDKVLEYCNTGDITCDTTNVLPGFASLPLEGFFDFAPRNGQFTPGAFYDIANAAFSSPAKFQQLMNEAPELIPSFIRHLTYLVPGDGIDKSIQFIKERNV